MAVFERSFDLTASLDEVWEFHGDPAALARITPKPLTLIPHGTRVTDYMEYEMPLGALGRIADAIGGRFMIASMFNARSRATRALLERDSA